MIKQQYSSMFGKQCPVCPQRHLCLAATSVTSDLRRYFLKICGHRQKANAAMLQGTKNHEERQKGIPSIEDIGQREFMKKLYLGETIELKECFTCSPSYGLRGIVDIVRMTYGKDNKVYVEIRELKTGYSPKYIMQLIAYALMFSDRNMLLYYPKKGRKKTTHIPFKLYPNGQFDLTIILFLEILSQKKTTMYQYMLNNVVDSNLQGLASAVIMKANERRKYHKFGIYYIENIPPCKWCKKTEDFCSLWNICQKVNYIEDRKTKQRYFGKKDLIVKSKPHLAKHLKK